MTLLYLFLIGSVFASEAEDKAIEAGFIQSGLKANVELIGRYVVKKYPVMKDASVFYLTYKNRCVKFNIIETSVELKEDRINLGWRF